MKFRIIDFLVVGRRGVVGASGGGVETSAQRLVGVLVGASGSRDSGAGVGSVVRRTVVMRGSARHEGASWPGSTSHLRVVSSSLAGLATTEELAAAAGSVAVAGAGSKALFLLVMPAQSDLDESGDEEENSSDDGDGEADSGQAASRAQGYGVSNLVAFVLVGALEALLRVGLAVSKWGVDLAGAARCAIAGQDSNGDESAGEENIKDHGKECEEGLAAQEAGQEHSKDGVEDGDTGQTGDGLPSGEDSEVAVGKHRQEVGEDS